MKASFGGDISRLVPSPVSARASKAGRWPFAFGPRFFVALLVCLVWLGPAWWDHRFVYFVLLWDALVLLIWLQVLRRTPRPDQIEITREWQGPLHLGEPAQVVLQARCDAPASIHISLEDDLPDSLVAAPLAGEIHVRGSQTASLAYS